MARRRSNGEGTVDRQHDHPTCPASVDGVRPAHRCQGRYRARVTVTVNGLRVRKTVYGKTQAECLARMDDVKAADRAGQAVVGKGCTVAQWMDEWFATASQGWKPNTSKCVRQRIDTWVKPYLGSLRLDRVTPQHVDHLYRAMRAAGRREGTVRQVHVMLRRALKVAVNYGKVSTNATDRVEAPGTEQQGRAGMTLGEARAVLAAAGDDPRAYVALLCGLRQGEALGLQWGDLYLDGPEPYLVVRRSVCRVTGVGLVFTTPKSRASHNREVPLLPEVVARLRVQHAKHLAKGWGQDDALVFCTSKRTPYSSTQDRLNWDRVLAKAGVDNYTLHSARNTCAHLLEDAGNLPRVVADILGHSKVETTYIYQRGNQAAKSKAMRGLGQHLALQGGVAA